MYTKKFLHVIVFWYLKQNLPGWRETPPPWTSQSLEVTEGPAEGMVLIRKLASPQPHFLYLPKHPGSNFPLLSWCQGQVSGSSYLPKAQGCWNALNEWVLNCLPALLCLPWGNPRKRHPKCYPLLRSVFPLLWCFPMWSMLGGGLCLLSLGPVSIINCLPSLFSCGHTRPCQKGMPNSLC